jgi:hypothetical protein
MTIAQRRQMARLERLATQLLDLKSKQPESRIPIDDELEGVDEKLLTRDEQKELSDLCDAAVEMGSGSSALPPASGQRFQELVAKGTPKR